MAPMDAPAALIGPLAGVVVGGGVAWAIERSRWKRAEATRWHAERRRVYAAFLRAAADVHWASSFIGVVGVARATRSSKGDFEQGLERFQEALDEWYRVHFEIDLLAGPKVRAAAQEVRSVISHSLALTHQIETPTDPGTFRRETKTVMDDLLAAIGAFEHEVRREIGP
jgi:hypothetical protein